jgi:hypothetical protein
VIVLSQTTDKIQIVLNAVVATNQAQCIASWRDITATPTYTAGRSLELSNNTTDVDLVASPSASTQRVIDFISVFNNDTAVMTVTVKFDASGTDYILWRGSLAQGERLEYENGKGWTITNANGATVSVGEAGANGINGSDGALTVSETEIDFGVPSYEKTITVIDASITPSSKIIACQSGKAATDKQSDENEMDSLVLNCVPGTGQFVLNVRAIPGPVAGKFRINYQFS